MRKALRTYSSDAIAVVVLAVIAIFVGGYILANQRFYLPGWVPFVGTDFYTLKAEMQTAQAISPGQGQTVAMAGVPVGEITGVKLENGRAVVTMSIESQYAHLIHENATMLARPKTGLQDMLLELNPGTPGAPKAPNGYTLPVSQTLPTVNTDEILASLDTGTRNYLKLLIGGAGEGLNGNSQELSAVFRRFAPTSRDIAKITTLLAARHRYVARNITNLKKIAQALEGNDTVLTQWVHSANAVFADFASQDASLREALSELPTALNATNSAVISADKLGRTLGPTLASLQPFATNLKAASIAGQEFFKATTPVLKNQIRPFSVKVQPTVKTLRPTAANLAKSNPQLSGTLGQLNYIFNTLAYKPKGSNGYLFFLGWLNHIGALSFTNQDALGPVRHGIFLLNCFNAQVIAQIKRDSTPLGTLSNLINAPPVETACVDDPAALAAAKAQAEADAAAKAKTTTTTTPAATTRAVTPVASTTATTTPAAPTSTSGPVPTTSTTPKLAETPKTTAEGGTR